MQRRRSENEDGAMLIIALIFFTIFALIMSALVVAVSANIKATNIVQSHENQIYGADAGIEYGIQAMRRDNTLCPDTGATTTIGSITVNGRTVNVTCSTLAGSATGGMGYAVILTDPTVNSITSQSGGSKTISGPVYAEYLPASVDVTIKNGDLFEHKANGGCTTDADRPGSTVFVPSTVYGFHCVTTTLPNVPHALPTAVPALAPAPITASGCTMFRPGKYTTVPLGSKNYFASGVYYFENVGNMNFTSQGSVGGAQGTAENNVNGNVGCATDAQAGGGSGGSGVKFILGGNSSLSVDNPKGELELYTRAGGPASEGTQGMSLMTVPAAATGGWLPSSVPLDIGSPILSVNGGSNPKLTIHGLVWVLDKQTVLHATNDSDAQVLGGIVTGRLFLKSSSSASGLAVSVDTQQGQRTTVITATAVGSTDSSRDVVATAVVQLSSDVTTTPPRITVINSWRQS